MAQQKPVSSLHSASRANPRQTDLATSGKLKVTAMFNRVVGKPFLWAASLAALLLILVVYAAHASPQDNAPLTCRVSKIEGPVAASSVVEWVTTTTAGGQTQLDRWCRTVGPAFFRAPQRPRPDSDGRILVIDWNMHV